MIRTEINPAWMDSATYLAFLRRNFPDQWDRRSFDWYLKRPFGGRAPDIAVRTEHGRILSGTGLVYRQLADARGRLFDACIVTAVSTLRSERGRGHYVSLLETATRVARENSCHALLGFVTRGNVSGLPLRRMGAYCVPSYYVFSAGRSNLPPTAARRLPRPLPAARLDGLKRRPAAPAARFHYADPVQWRSQFLQRPNPVAGWRVAHDALALVERVGATDRLQWLDCPPEKSASAIAALAAASRAARRRFFMYTMDPQVAQAAARLGLGVGEGYLLVLPLEGRGDGLAALTRDPWFIDSGDRM